MRCNKQRTCMAATLLWVGAALILSGCTILGTGVGTVDAPEKEGIQLYPTSAGLKGLNVTDICALSKLLKDSETDSPRLAFLLSDTPINPGNSGGPLIELGGNAVGINMAILRET